MKRLLSLLIAILMVIGLLAGCGQTGSSSPSSGGDAAPDEGPILIGCATALTGERALTGEYTKNAVDMAVKEINDAGGLLGREVKVIYEDDLGTDAGAVNAFNKLADQEVVAVIGSLFSTLDVAISGEVLKSEIPTVVTGSSISIGELGNPWMFQARSSDAVSATAIAKYAVDNLGLTKIAIIHDSDAFGQGASQAAIAELKNMGIEPVSVTTYNGGDKDYTPQILNIQQSGADVILAFSLQTEAGLIMKQLNDMGVGQPLIGSASFASMISIDLAKEAAEGVYSVADYVHTTPLEKGQEFAQKYLEAYGIESDWSSASKYDSFSLITEAIRIAGSTDNTAIRDAMKGIKGFACASNTFTFNEKNVGGTSVLIVQIVNGVPEVLESVTAV